METIHKFTLPLVPCNASFETFLELFNVSADNHKEMLNKNTMCKYQVDMSEILR